jgi:hypothetical protein
VLAMTNKKPPAEKRDGKAAPIDGPRVLTRGAALVAEMERLYGPDDFLVKALRATQDTPAQAPAGERSGIVYLLECTKTGALKVGFTGDELRKRFLSISGSAPYPLRVLAQFFGPMRKEKEIHKKFAAVRIHHEWYEPHAREGLVAAFEAAVDKRRGRRRKA